jgi:DNA-binding transcriptional MerR regulator/quercetin dioxygenase-like cupin family protein
LSKSSGKTSSGSRAAKSTRVLESGKALKIGTVAKRLGVSASMVRSWDRLGLTHPARTKSKYRLYSNEDLRVMRRAIYLRRVRGLNPPGILNQLRQEGLLKPRDLSESNGQPAVGARFRKLRSERGESLATVAQAIGVSIGFLSNLERSHSGASIGIMRKLAQYYGLNILDLFSPSDSTGPLIRPADRKKLEGGPGVQMELLAFGNFAMEPHLFRVLPGAGSGESYAHHGEEFLYIMTGRLNIALGAENFQLRAGDSFYFTSDTPHSWTNPGKGETTILWINTPPTF